MSKEQEIPRTKITIELENAKCTVEVSQDTTLDDMIRVFEGLLHQMGYYFDGALELKEFPRENEFKFEPYNGTTYTSSELANALEQDALACSTVVRQAKKLKKCK